MGGDRETGVVESLEEDRADVVRTVFVADHGDDAYLAVGLQPALLVLSDSSASRRSSTRWQTLLC